MNVLLLGASGSIGQQSLDVMKKNRKDFSLLGFSLGRRTRYISHIVKTFPEVKYICIQDKSKKSYFCKKYPGIAFFFGDEGLLEIVKKCPSEMVVNALVGFVGLLPTIKALKLNKKVALANKETLVVGGEIVNELINKGHGVIYPIDSEHAAIAKCLDVDDKNVDKLILTASGGAFRNLTREELVNVKARDALNHPTWRMGEKITIDCATMVNKCFEVIEAHYLFNYPKEKIDIILHQESRVHSMVKYLDGTYRADVSRPDMRNPIKYALYEKCTDFKTYVANDYHDFGEYHFKEFDINRYPVIKWAGYVIDNKGTYGAVLNATNEVAVHAYLKDEIPFLLIEEIIEKMMDENKNIKHPSIEQIVMADQLTREKTREYIKNWRKLHE